MADFVIVTDSTSNLPAEEVRRYGIPVIPLKVHWGDQTYLDGVTLTPDTFYRWLAERRDFPSTSQPSAGEFIEFFRRVANEHNTDTIVGIFISSQMSGTVTSAMQAQSQISDLRLELIDSRSVSMGLGLQVLAAARAAAEGKALSEVLDIVRHCQSTLQVVFAVDTLEFLHRGGRIGGAARLLGSALNLKPVLTIEDGRVEALEKVRSRRRSLARTLELIQERVAGRQVEGLAIMHANAPEDADWVRSALLDLLHPEYSYTCVLTPVVGTHGGPGTVGVAAHSR